MFDSGARAGPRDEATASSLVERAMTALLDRSRPLALEVYPAVPWLAVEWTADERGAGSAQTSAPAPAPATRGAEHHVTPPHQQLAQVLEVGIGHLEGAAAALRAMARLWAEVATSLAAFARCRPSALFDRQPGEQGAMSAATRAARSVELSEVSEWAVDEVALTLGISSSAASAQLVESLVLVEQLPGTLALLARGAITPAHARQMVNVVGPVEDDALRADIEAHVLGLLGHKTPSQLGDCARRVVLRKDADAAARRLVAAVRERGVRLIDRRDGTGTVSVDLPLPAAAAIYRALEAYAEGARADGDERTKQQRMADCVQDLVLRPGEHGMPPVTIALTLVASLETMLGGAEPGQVEGMLVPADMVRELGYAFGLMPRPAPDLSDLPDDAAPALRSEAVSETPAAPTAARGSATRPPETDAEPRADAESRADAEPEPPPGGTDPAPTPVQDRPLDEWLALARARTEAAVRDGLTGAKQAIIDGRWCDGELRALLDVGALMSAPGTTGSALAHRPHVAVVDKLRGSLVALTDAAGIRRGEALGPPTTTERYAPGAELDRFVRLRDRRCRFPGCRARARTCDLDHRAEWPTGSTAHDNLWCLCQHHHRLKHQAPGWRVDDAGDGGVAITTPGGTRLVSRPPPVGSDLDVPPF